MAQRKWSLAAYLAGFLVVMGTLRMAFRMLDGGAPWPLAALVVAAGAALMVLLFRFRGRRDRTRSPRS